MRTGHPEPPRRIPPPAIGPLPPRVARGDRAGAAVVDTSTLTPGGLGVQEQLDELATQADQLQSQLRHAQKLAALGSTAAMIAHEFNNLFTPVVAYARQALDTGDVELMRKALDKTLTQGAVVRQMSDRVVGMARQSDTVIRPVCVLDIVQQAIESLGRGLEKDNITVILQVDPGLRVRANESLLLQVLFNLVLNARQAMLGRRGRLTIDAAEVGDSVALSIRDTGCGIAAENLARIFQPFFTTRGGADRPDRRGLGLGLSICLDIIEELGGTIDVESEVNVGTAFTLSLPRAE